MVANHWSNDGMVTIHRSGLRGSQQEEAEEEEGVEQEAGLELEEEIGHMADEKLANAKIFFTLSLSRMFYCFVFDDHFCFQHFISVSLMTNRAGLKLLRNYNKVGHCVLSGPVTTKNL